MSDLCSSAKDDCISETEDCEASKQCAKSPCCRPQRCSPAIITLPKIGALTGDIVFNGDITFNGDTIFNGPIDASDTTTTLGDQIWTDGSTITVDGDITFEGEGTIDFTNVNTIGLNLDILVDVTLQGETIVDGNVTYTPGSNTDFTGSMLEGTNVDTDLGLTGNLTINGTLNVTGNINLTGTITITGVLNVTAVTNFFANVTFAPLTTVDFTGVTVLGLTITTNDVTLTGTTTITGTLNVTANATFSGTVTLTGIVNITGVLNISAVTNFTGNVTFAPGTTVDFTGVTVLGLTVTLNDVTLTGTTTITGVLNVSAATTFTGAVTIALGGSLTVAVGATATFNGTTVINNILSITAATTISGAVTLSGAVTITGPTLNISAATTTTIDGTVTINGPTLTVSAATNTTINGPTLTISAATNTTINGPTLTVSAATTTTINGPSITISAATNTTINGPTLTVSAATATTLSGTVVINGPSLTVDAATTTNINGAATLSGGVTIAPFTTLDLTNVNVIGLAGATTDTNPIANNLVVYADAFGNRKTADTTALIQQTLYTNQSLPETGYFRVRPNSDLAGNIVMQSMPGAGKLGYSSIGFNAFYQNATANYASGIVRYNAAKAGWVFFSEQRFASDVFGLKAGFGLAVDSVVWSVQASTLLVDFGFGTESPFYQFQPINTGSPGPLALWVDFTMGNILRFGAAGIVNLTSDTNPILNNLVVYADASGNRKTADAPVILQQAITITSVAAGPTIFANSNNVDTSIYITTTNGASNRGSVMLGRTTIFSLLTDTTLNNTADFGIVTGINVPLRILASDLLVRAGTGFMSSRYDLINALVNAPPTLTSIWADTTGFLRYGAGVVLVDPNPSVINAIPVYTGIAGQVDTTATLTSATLARPLTSTAAPLSTGTVGNISVVNVLGGGQGGLLANFGGTTTGRHYVQLYNTGVGGAVAFRFSKSADQSLQRWLLGMTSTLGGVDDFHLFNYQCVPARQTFVVSPTTNIVTFTDLIVVPAVTFVPIAASPGDTTVWVNSVDDSLAYGLTAVITTANLFALITQTYTGIWVLNSAAFPAPVNLAVTVTKVGRNVTVFIPPFIVTASLGVTSQVTLTPSAFAAFFPAFDGTSIQGGFHVVRDQVTVPNIVQASWRWVNADSRWIVEVEINVHNFPGASDTAFFNEGGYFNYISIPP